MKFKYRLAYYLFGLTLGGFLVTMIFNGRGQDFCYLPNCRVLKNIRSKGIYVSDEVKKTYTEGWVNQKDVDMTLQYGDVDFDKSNKPVKGGKLYTIEGKNAKGEPIIIEVVNNEEKATLLTVKKL
ncbi:DUF4258 domain-containing protein [Flavobacterium sp. RHBU_3]|uniref:DUF4258 domain-containing protein n=1 Tax=Flavobacterium sp. RHBU_3 TaxID=3391184 RepID=UPI003985666B